MECLEHAGEPAVAICAVCSPGLCRACRSTRGRISVCLACHDAESDNAVKIRLMLRERAQGKQARACSFCLKQESEVHQLIAGAGVFICNECVSTCSEILAEKRGD